MKFVQARIVSDDVERTAGFFASVLDTDVPLNGYYVEVPAGDATIGISRLHYTEWESNASQIILDFEVEDLDEQYQRLDRLGVEWVLRPTVQPWGNRSMTFRSPDGVVVNVFAR